MKPYRFTPGRQPKPPAVDEPKRGPGAPKGRVSLVTYLKRILDEPIKPGQPTHAELIMEALVNHAILGDIRHIQEILNRIEGKVPERIQASISNVDKLSDETLAELAKLSKDASDGSDDPDRAQPPSPRGGEPPSGGAGTGSSSGTVPTGD